MVVMDSEMISEGEVESPLQAEQPKNFAFSSLGRQLSIYSLTLDEFQDTLCESGKNFGSMNMDEFINSIWTAEESQAQAHAHAQATSAMAPNSSINPTTTASQLPLGEGSPSGDHKGIAKQPSLPRQGSLTLPPPLSRKTVDQVWAEIYRSEGEQQHNNSINLQSSGSTQQRQLTFGEMTLEDFLIRAGIVREQYQPPQLPQQQPYGGFYQKSNNTEMGPGFPSRPVMNLGDVSSGGPVVNVAAYGQAMPQSGVGEVSAYQGNMNKGGGYLQQKTAACYGGRMGKGSGVGYAQGLGVASPVSPVSSDGLCANQVHGAKQYGMDMGGTRGGRKRIIDGPIEKVVERRRRRMIKNRESAARSRARKQAYTVELEAELSQLKEENAHLKQALAEMERKRRQQQFEETKMKAQTKAEKANEKLRIIRRSSS